MRGGYSPPVTHLLHKKVFILYTFRGLPGDTNSIQRVLESSSFIQTQSLVEPPLSVQHKETDPSHYLNKPECCLSRTQQTATCISIIQKMPVLLYLHVVSYLHVSVLHSHDTNERIPRLKKCIMGAYSFMYVMTYINMFIDVLLRK